MRPTVAIPTLLAATIGGPYVASNGPQWFRQWGESANGGHEIRAADATTMTASAPPLPSTFMAGVAPAARSPLSTPLVTSPFAPRIDPRFAAATPLEGTPAMSLAEVLRFDVTKEWVYQRWARKSTALGELDLYGVRVPLVTGTQLADLAGSLTYYFNDGGRVERISFHGRTADTTQVVQLAAQQFGLARQATPVVGEQLFQTRRGADVLSELRTRPAPVLWAASPHDSFTVDLELQEPSLARPLRLTSAAGDEGSRKVAPASAGGEGASAEAKLQADARAKADAAAVAKAKLSAEDRWKLWFPRSRVSRPQLQQLDQTHIWRH